jgi:hypothetical protein
MVKFFRHKQVVIASKAWQSLKLELETNRLLRRKLRFVTSIKQYFIFCNHRNDIILL